MHSFNPNKIIVLVFFVYLTVTESFATGKIMSQGTDNRPPRSLQKNARDNNQNVSSTTPMMAVAAKRNRSSSSNPSPRRINLKKPKVGRNSTLIPTVTKRRRQDAAPTPEPTGDSSASTTVYVFGPSDFALLLPANSGEMVSDAEQDGVAYCTSGSGCGNPFPNGLITGAAYAAADDGSYVQITGCIDANQFPFATGDDGGQFDVRFPNGAQCTFGGYGASFIEQVEPSANRFCLRCCKSADDQVNCDSHQDRAGCPVAIPGTYEFGEVGCS